MVKLTLEQISRPFDIADFEKDIAILMEEQPAVKPHLVIASMINIEKFLGFLMAYMAIREALQNEEAATKVPKDAVT